MGCMSGVSCVYMRMGATHSGQMILLLTMRNEKLHHDNTEQRLGNLTINRMCTDGFICPFLVSMLLDKPWLKSSFLSRQKNDLMAATVVKAQQKFLLCYCGSIFTCWPLLTFLTDREMFSRMRSFTLSWSMPALLAANNRLSADSLISVYRWS